jgi:hypothetical protein
MDETPVWFEMPGKSTLAERGEKEVRVATTGHEKERLTVTLAAYADGTKLPPLVHLPDSDRLLDGWSYMCPKGIPNEKTAFLVI